MPNDPILFEDFAFTPADGLKNHEYSPTEPESEEAIREQIQGVSDQLRDHINSLQGQLNAVTAGNSGAHYIGAAEIAGIAGENVAQQLSSLKTLIEETAIGAIPDHTIETVKLKDGVVTAEKLAEHAVTEEKLTSGCVTNTKIADGAVTYEKLSSDMGDFHEKVLIMKSGTWSPPFDGIYTVTLLGGGGGGGSGFGVYDTTLNSNSNNPRTFFSGAGGDASVPVTKRLALYQSETYTFLIGAGGAGRTGRSYVMKTAGSGYSTPPTFTSCDGFATEGGESSMSIGGTVILQTTQRTKGCPFGCYVGASMSINITTALGGGSGAGQLPGTRNSLAIKDYDIPSGQDVVIEEGPGLMGGGRGGRFSRSLHIAGTASHAGNATGYGCGGGGGCAPYISYDNPKSSAPYSFINKGGKGGNGYALIEWFAPLAMPQA